MRIDYTDLEKEKKLRIEAQLALLQEQANRLVAERQALFNSILERAKVKSQKGNQEVFSAKFYGDYAEVKFSEKKKGKKS